MKSLVFFSTNSVIFPAFQLFPPKRLSTSLMLSLTSSIYCLATSDSSFPVFQRPIESTYLVHVTVASAKFQLGTNLSLPYTTGELMVAPMTSVLPCLSLGW